MPAPLALGIAVCKQNGVPVKMYEAFQIILLVAELLLNDEILYFYNHSGLRFQNKSLGIAIRSCLKRS